MSLKKETALISVSDRNPAPRYSRQPIRPKKPSKIKGSNHAVYSLELWNLSGAIGLRNKQDTPKVTYTLRDSAADQPGCSL